MHAFVYLGSFNEAMCKFGRRAEEQLTGNLLGLQPDRISGSNCYKSESIQLFIAALSSTLQDEQIFQPTNRKICRSQRDSFIGNPSRFNKLRFHFETR